MVTDCYLFFTCTFLFFIFFFRGAFNIQASNMSNAIYGWVMRYQSLEINYHTAPNNKSTALPILQKLISIMVCLLGRAEYIELWMCGKPGFAARPAVRWSCYIASQLTACRPDRSPFPDVNKAGLAAHESWQPGFMTLPQLEYISEYFCCVCLKYSVSVYVLFT